MNFQHILGYLKYIENSLKKYVLPISTVDLNGLGKKITLKSSIIRSNTSLL